MSDGNLFLSKPITDCWEPCLLIRDDTMLELHVRLDSFPLLGVPRFSKRKWLMNTLWHVKWESRSFQTTKLKKKFSNGSRSLGVRNVLESMRATSKQLKS